ncbi:hypothetical protein NX059_004820 [Plenodomus lindquistii]|nr:hypothetical protein NX059_004820 [Plenodomus lindquistii]
MSPSEPWQQMMLGNNYDNKTPDWNLGRGTNFIRNTIISTTQMQTNAISLLFTRHTPATTLSAGLDDAKSTQDSIPSELYEFGP